MDFPPHQKTAVARVLSIPLADSANQIKSIHLLLTEAPKPCRDALLEFKHSDSKCPPCGNVICDDCWTFTYYSLPGFTLFLAAAFRASLSHMIT